jgi:hypothetical protein
MIAMKNIITKAKAPTRSVKVADPLHHKLRIKAAQERMGLQEFIHGMLTTGMKLKIYKEFLPTGETPPPTTE